MTALHSHRPPHARLQDHGKSPSSCIDQASISITSAIMPSLHPRTAISLHRFRAKLSAQRSSATTQHSTLNPSPFTPLITSTITPAPAPSADRPSIPHTRHDMQRAAA
ncbi:hypothetical protein AcW1_010203 [Taiwanofungus camphoratus]|nr:hypothetical protein AcV5_003091 [Antrodia cinnamomea]KAI0946868.1 hypothetical protein AcW1_010203 [Antrodia cinnamomea]